MPSESWSKRVAQDTTLAVIAEKLGVSVTTVSRALRDRPDISPATKQRVLELAEQMGYVPNALASGLRTRRMPFIGAVIIDSANPFFAGVLRGIQDSAFAKGHQILLYNTDYDHVREQQALYLLRQLKVAGILLFPVQAGPQGSQEALRSRVPVVFMGRHYENAEANWTAFDDRQGGYLATRHTIQQGYPKVAYLGGQPGSSSSEERFQGYRRALEEFDRPYYGSMVVCGSKNIKEGQKSFREVVSMHKPPLGVFCFNDLVAIGALKAAQELGLRVPDDVGIVGYDDVEMASVVSVPLTTIRTPHYGLGQTATELLFDVLSGDKEPTGHHVVLQPELVVRASC